MKVLQKLLEGIPYRQIAGASAVQVRQLDIDSRTARPGSLFFARKGTRVDGAQHIPDAIRQGAVAIVCARLPETCDPAICYIEVSDVEETIGLIAASFYDFPVRQLKVIGVTGTNGKTTIATLLFKLFSALGHSCGLISTVQNQIGDEILSAARTTPDAISLQKLFAAMVARGCRYVFMEVSSHAIHQKRIAGITFSGGIFSNITHDHLDYHKTFDAYIAVKKSFFDRLPPDAFALSNNDDKRGRVMLQNTPAQRKYYALRNEADFKGKILENDLNGLQMMIEDQEVHFLMRGRFNAYNLLAVYGAARLCGVDKIKILSALSGLQGAPGRFETYSSPNEKITGIVDYAHTPDALLNILTTIRQLNPPGKVLTVIGCGGDRDKAKRPLMAGVACEHSDRVILTSDNPRSEDPMQILNDMEAGITPRQQKKTIRVINREEAIKTACMLAQRGDILLIAGKGHETYQEINGAKIHFDDKEVLLKMFQLLEK